jgi:hypothetical protein
VLDSGRFYRKIDEKEIDIACRVLSATRDDEAAPLLHAQENEPLINH